MIITEKIEPAHDLVLVRRISTVQTPAGIILPAHPDKEEPMVARIVAIGPGISGKPETKPKCEVGEYWLMARFIGTVFPINGRDHTMVKWADCQGKMTFSEMALKLLDDAIDGPDEQE